ncbi:Ig-like domain-containing protein [Aquibacillus saliphilus]|uniref:Ig-like domain-containing protein n=1 Tax=Aquibacillus saliphilus TaxID=1909422 RepID=UPI001CF0B1CF|nr:Ig-like domain-containing protein [Aquibacillus saliphilus]
MSSYHSEIEMVNESRKLKHKRRRIMKRSHSLAKLFFIATLIFTTLASSYGSSTIFAQDNVVDRDTSGDFDYNPVLGEDVQVDPNFEVNAGEGDVFSEGNIRFEISDGHVESERFFIPENSQVQLDGSTLIYSDGEFLLDGVPVAAVNATNNGDGTALQIDLSAPLENGDFEKELEGNEVQDWTINDTSEHPTNKGTTINQIWLGDLATKTKGNSYRNFTNNGDGTYTATGPNDEYTYQTDVDYSGIVRSGVAASIEGNEVLFSGSQGTLVKGLIDDNGNNRLELGFKSGSIDSNASGYGSVFRIEAWSTPFQAKAGDALYFDWRAFTVPNDTSNYDDFEVYGFIVDDEGNHTEILYGRGKDKKWTTVQKEIPEDGQYQFRFVSGSFDQTDGGKLGATLWIDNARVVSNKVVKDVVDAIGQMVHYQNPLYSGDRNVNISLMKENGETSELVDPDVTIRMMTQEEAADWLKSNLSILTPNEGTLVYDANTLVTITGDTKEYSAVNVSIDDPNNQEVFNGQPTVGEDGNWTIDYQGNLIKGDYTIIATATKGGATSDAVTRIFTLVDTSELENYIEDDIPGIVTDEEDYQNGWSEYQTKLINSQDLLDRIGNESSTPTQAAVDQVLQELRDAVAALEKHAPIETVPATYEHGGNEIVIEFDKPVTLTNSTNPEEGFTVSVDGTNYPVLDAVMNGNLVTLTVDHELDSDAKKVQVNYDETTGSLYGDEQNGSADEAFSIIATDEFGAGLQIVNTIGNTDDRTPRFNGSVHTNADSVRLTIKYQDHEVVAGFENVEADLESGKWTYTVPNDFAYGGYTVEVTATNDDGGPRTVTKSETFFIVNKENIQAEYDAVDGFVEEDYRLGWDDFEEAVQHAESVINDPTAFQDDVDQAITNLEVTRNSLEKHAPVVERASYYHGHNNIYVVFDKDVMFTDEERDLTSGFILSVDGKEMDIVAVERISEDLDGKTQELKLTLPEGEELLSEIEVKVDYRELDGNSNLSGDEENGTAVEDFEFVASDDFGLALQISNPNAITDDTTPSIVGTADKSADSASLTIIGPNGEDRVVDQDELTIGSDGTWIYQVEEKLAPGEYEVVVTASEADREDVIKHHSFTVVDKEDLIKLKDMIDSKKLKANFYTEGTWKEYSIKYSNAEGVINNPNSTQSEVDSALKELKSAYDDLLLKTVKDALDKAEIEKKLTNKTKKVYTDAGGSESDDAYKDVNNELNKLEEELKKKPVELDLDKILYRIDELKKDRENLELATDQLISDQLKDVARFLTRDTAFTFSQDDTWESVTLKFLMLSEGPYDTKITWSSSQSKVISLDGYKATTTRHGSDKSVILTATISKGNQKLEKTFLVIVKQENISKKMSETTKRNASVGVNNNTLPTPSIERINLFTNDNQLVNKIDKIIVNNEMVPDVTTGTFSVYLPDDQANIADELALEVTADTLNKLKGILELKTDQATIVLNQSEVQRLADNGLELFFRIVPLRDERDKNEVSKRMMADQSVLAEVNKVSGSASAKLVGTPKEIETNYSGYKTDIILPIGEFYHDGLDLDRLRVYIEHSDGTIDVQKGTIIYENDTPTGYKFSVDKFSTFTLFEVEIVDDSTTDPNDLDNNNEEDQDATSGTDDHKNDQDISQEPQKDTNGTEENQLPITALNMFKYLIMGLLLFGFGVSMYYFQRRRREN